MIFYAIICLQSAGRIEKLFCEQENVIRFKQYLDGLINLSRIFNYEIINKFSADIIIEKEERREIL